MGEKNERQVGKEFLYQKSKFIKMQVYGYVIVDSFPKANQSINKVPMYLRRIYAAFSISFFPRSLYPRQSVIYVPNRIAALMFSPIE